MDKMLSAELSVLHAAVSLCADAQTSPGKAQEPGGISCFYGSEQEVNKDFIV